MERFFNTAGPQTPDSYTIDPLSRIDLDDVLTLIRQQRYFVLHAPRQTGKTTCMLALRDYLNREDDYIAVYVNVEAGQAKRNDVDSVVRGIWFHRRSSRLFPTANNVSNSFCRHHRYMT